jgi:hypothetical protein
MHHGDIPQMGSTIIAGGGILGALCYCTGAVLLFMFAM